MELQSGLLQDIKVGQSCSVKECSVGYWVIIFHENMSCQFIWRLSVYNIVIINTIYRFENKECD